MGLKGIVIGYNEKGNPLVMPSHTRKVTLLVECNPAPRLGDLVEYRVCDSLKYLDFASVISISKPTDEERLDTLTVMLSHAKKLWNKSLAAHMTTDANNDVYLDLNMIREGYAIGEYERAAGIAHDTYLRTLRASERFEFKKGHGDSYHPLVNTLLSLELLIRRETANTKPETN